MRAHTNIAFNKNQHMLEDLNNCTMKIPSYLNDIKKQEIFFCFMYMYMRFINELNLLHEHEEKSSKDFRKREM